MNLENKINEISQTQKTNIHLSEVSRTGKCIEIQKQNTGYQGVGVGSKGNYLMGTEFLCGMMKSSENGQ